MYEALKNALMNVQGVQFAEYEWHTHPQWDFGTFQIDFDARALVADGIKQEQAVEGSVDVFLHAPDKTKIAAIEAALESVCGSAFRKNSRQYEQQTGLLHIEWVFQLECE